MGFSLKKLLVDLAADAVAVKLDEAGGSYDRLHESLEKQVSLPKNAHGRTVVSAVMLLASRVVEQLLGPLGPVGGAIHEVTSDGVREMAKRILEAAGDKMTATKQLKDSPTGLDAVWEMDETTRKNLLEQFRQLDEAGQQQMREQMLRATAAELVVYAGMSREDLGTILSVMAPKPKTPVQESVRSGLETLTAQMNKWAGR